MTELFCLYHKNINQHSKGLFQKGFCVDLFYCRSVQGTSNLIYSFKKISYAILFFTLLS